VGCLLEAWQIWHHLGSNVATLALGSRPRQGLARLRVMKGSLWAKESVKEWTLTLPREFPPWELESRWTLECLKSYFKGQNLMNWRVLYTIEKTIETSMSKMGFYDPFGHLKHKLWPKERLGVKLVVWFPTIKSLESTQFPCMQVACNISSKSSRQVLQLCFRLHLNWRSTRKVMGPQSRRSPNFGNFGTPIWES